MATDVTSEASGTSSDTDISRTEAGTAEATVLFYNSVLTVLGARIVPTWHTEFFEHATKDMLEFSTYEPGSFEIFRHSVTSLGTKPLVIAKPFFDSSDGSEQLRSINPDDVSDYRHYSTSNVDTDLFREHGITFSLASRVGQIDMITPKEVVQYYVDRPITESGDEPKHSLLVRLQMCGEQMEQGIRNRTGSQC